jgi:hypothetical protein
VPSERPTPGGEIEQRVGSYGARSDGEEIPCLWLDCNVKSDVLLLSFAVFPDKGKPPSFDFVGSTSRLGVKRAFFRDPHMVWYQRGVPGVGSTIPEVAQFIREVMDREKARRVVAIGHSGGGYAAILFGVLAGVDEVHSFNPPTRLLDADDTTMPHRLAALEEIRSSDPDFLDLHIVLQKYYTDRTGIFIHYSRGKRRDRQHAKYLASFRNVQTIEYPLAGHHLPHFLRRIGLLAPLLRAATDADRALFRRTTLLARLAAAPLYVPGRVLRFFRGRVQRMNAAL